MATRYGQTPEEKAYLLGYRSDLDGLERLWAEVPMARWDGINSAYGRGAWDAKLHKGQGGTLVEAMASDDRHEVA